MIMMRKFIDSMNSYVGRIASQVWAALVAPVGEAQEMATAASKSLLYIKKV